VTPIKGFGLSHPDEVWLDRSGARGDRDLFIVDARGRVVSISETGTFAGYAANYADDGRALILRHAGTELVAAPLSPGAAIGAVFWAGRIVRGTVMEGPWSEILSGIAGRPVRLVRADMPGVGSDVHAVTVLGSASAEELSRRVGRPVDARRFRMLVHLGTGRAHEEDDWDGKVLVGAHAALRVGGRVPRCAAVTRDPDRGDRDLPVVREIKAYRGMHETEIGRGVCFGVYADVTREGPLRVGELLELRPANDAQQT